VESGKSVIKPSGLSMTRLLHMTVKCPACTKTKTFIQSFLELPLFEICVLAIANVVVAHEQLPSSFMILNKVLLIQILLVLSSLRVALAIPIRVNDLRELKNSPQSQSSKTTKTDAQTHQGGILKKVAPYFGAASVLALIGGLVYFGTRHEETHNEALEAQKREQLQRYMESDEWNDWPDLAESVTSGELRGITKAGKADREKLEKLKEMRVKLNKEIAEKQRDIILSYRDKVKQIQESHAKKGG